MLLIPSPFRLPLSVPPIIFWRYRPIRCLFHLEACIIVRLPAFGVPLPYRTTRHTQNILCERGLVDPGVEPEPFIQLHTPFSHGSLDMSTHSHNIFVDIAYLMGYQWNETWIGGKDEGHKQAWVA